MAGFTLNKPHPDHIPTTGRVPAGTNLTGDVNYGTRLACSCGYKPDTPHGIVSLKAPSKGGKTAAGHVYRRHLMQLGLDAPACDHEFTVTGYAGDQGDGVDHPPTYTGASCVHCGEPK